MPFVKGQKKTGGKTTGTLNKKSQQWEALGESIVTVHAKKFHDELSKLSGTYFIDAYTKVLSYFKPQLARTEIKGEVDNTLVIKEEHADNSFTPPARKSKENS